MKPRKLDTRLEAGAVVTDRERFLLGVIGYHYDQDNWYLDQCPEDKQVLRDDFGVTWDGFADAEGNV